MVEVYVWRRRDDISIGHASLRVSFDDASGCYDTYLSWWPTGLHKKETMRGTPAQVSRTFREDCDDEGIRPHRTFRFNNVFDEPKMLNLWARWKTDRQYQLMFNNCSSLVKFMLCQCGLVGDKLGGRFVNFCVYYEHIATPYDIEFYCDQLERFISSQKK